jgi:carboxyl-terminal processing protease
MDAPGRGRSKVWTPLLFSFVLIVGMVMGFNLRDTLRNKRDFSEVVNRNDRLEEIIDLIDQRYVDTVNSNTLYESSIAGILKSLDPHTVYIPAEDVQDVNDDLEGSFSGIGVEFSIVRDTVELSSVIDDGPAAKSGMELGDKVIKVGDSLVAGTGITSDRIVRLLKGKKNTNVIVTILKASNGSLTQLSITRDNIPLYSVEANFLVDSITAYIKINRFSATTYDEFKTALQKLQAQGAKQLLLDLRGNPGGYLAAAVSIADEMLDDKKLIVYTQGKHSPKSEFKAENTGLFEKGKVAVLVNERSASASEVLAGAIQDWDRGLIVGRRTFGKGLVQEQFEMSDGAALRLTVARYYTPSGRSIQRSFANGKEAYMQDYEKRFEAAELVADDSLNRGDTTIFYTSHHRPVYGGGGISPDIMVPFDTSLLSKNFMSIILSADFNNAVLDHFVHNRATLAYPSIDVFSKGFRDEKKIINNYIGLLSAEEQVKVQKELAKESNYQYLALQVKAQIARFLFRDNGYYSIKLKEDHTVNKALQALNSPQYLQVVGGNGK